MSNIDDGAGRIDDRLWVPLCQAADRLGVSERTLRRWVADGKVPNRLIDNRREVLIECADAGRPGVMSGGQESSVRQGGANVSGQGVELALHVEAVGSLLAVYRDDAQRQIARAEAEARRHRWSSRCGWSAAAVLVVAGGVAAGLVSWHVRGLTEAERLASRRLVEVEVEVQGARLEAAENARRASEAERWAQGLSDHLAGLTIDSAARAAAEGMRLDW